MGAKRRVGRWIVRGVGAVVAVGVWGLVLVALRHLTGGPAGGWAVPVVVAAGVAALWWWARRARWVVVSGVVALGGVVLWVATRTPRNDRDWTPDVARLARVTIDADRMTIQNVRNFAWRGVGEAEEAWETRAYDLSTLESMELIVEPFGDSGLFAHTMLNFGFSDGRWLLVSIEARKERGEKYGLAPGVLGRFEQVYVFMDERDGLTLRAVHRGHQVYAFPVKAEAGQFRALLEDLGRAADALNERPRFYRVVLDNCTTAWVRHVDRQRVNKIGLRAETLFPARTGELLVAEGMLDAAMAYEEALRVFRIDGRVREWDGREGFSAGIRGE